MRTCPKCNKPLREGAKFCGACGTKMNDKKKRIVVGIVAAVLMVAISILVVFLIKDNNTPSQDGGVHDKRPDENDDITQTVTQRELYVVLKPENEIIATNAQLDNAVQVMTARLDSNDISEKSIIADYEKNRIVLEIPWPSERTDATAKDIIHEISTTVKLTFTAVETDWETGELQSVGDVLVDGSNVKEAYVTAEDYGNYAIALTFDSKGTEDFKNATAALLGRQLGVVLNGQLISAPTVNEIITEGTCMISGDFSIEDAEQLANQLNSGSLPFNFVVHDFAFCASKNMNKNYIATVNGVGITVDDFEAELSAVVQEYLDTAVRENDLDTDDDVAVEQFWNSTNEAGISMRMAAKQEAMQNMVEYAVQLLVAEEKGIVLTEQEEDNLIKEAESNAEYYAEYYNNSYGTEYTAETFVEEMYGTSYSEYKRMYMESYIINQLASMMKDQMTIDYNAMQDWHDKNPDAYDLYMVDTIYVPYLGTDNNDNDVLLSGEELTRKQTIVADIEKELTAENFTEIAQDNPYAITSSNALQKTAGKVSLTNTTANMDEINTWLNKTGLADANQWKKFAVKGSAGSEFEESVIGVYFVKFNSKITFITPDNEDAAAMRDTIESEIMNDTYNKMVEEWATDISKYTITCNGDAYKNYHVAGYKAE